jgi:hypothetical protein
MKASKDLNNAKAAGVLMALLEKLKNAESKPETSAPAQTPVPATPAPENLAPAVPAPENPSPLQNLAPTPDKAVVPSQESAPKLGDASIINQSRALGGAMLVTSLFALGASYGIKHFVRV